MATAVRDKTLGTTLSDAPERRMEFAALIAPIEERTFFDTYWERQPLHLRGEDSGRFEWLLSLADIDRLLIDYGRAQPMDIRLAKYEDGREESLDPGSDQTALDVDRIFSAYAEGYTVNLNHLPQRHAPARELSTSLSKTFGCTVTVNAFLTPASACGFPLHFDTHDVLILQVEGAKSWQVHPPHFRLPTKTHTPPLVLSPQTAHPAIMDVVLEAGDVLYVPRGFGHHASTNDRPSLHLTVGFHTFTVFDLVEAALGVLAWDLPALRRSIRPNAVADQRSAAAGELAAVRALIAERLPLEDALSLLAARYLASCHAAPVPRFAAIDPRAVKALQAGSRVRKRPQTPCRVVEGRGWIAIQYPSHGLRVPLRMAPALEHIAESEEFLISELPGELGDDEKIRLVGRLVSEGLLVPVET
jgi:ribosomal protein L16 Arg81 hydroxylase